MWSFTYFPHGSWTILSEDLLHCMQHLPLARVNKGLFFITQRQAVPQLWVVATKRNTASSATSPRRGNSSRVVLGCKLPPYRSEDTDSQCFTNIQQVGNYAADFFLVVFSRRININMVREFAHGAMEGQVMVDPLSYFTFQPVLYDWCNKGHCICYPVCGMVHIKEPLLLIERVAHVAAAGFLSHFLNGPLQVKNLKCYCT